MDQKLTYHTKKTIKFSKVKLKQSAGCHIRIRHPQKKEEKQIQQIFNEKLKTKDKIITYEPKLGQGLVMASDKTLYGKGTNFREDVENGDFIMIENPILKTVEQKAVILVLSSDSILLQETFIEEGSTLSTYYIRKKTKIQPGEDIHEDYKKKLLNLSKTKGIKKDTIDLRLKKGIWSYEKKKIQVNDNLSREQLLNIRMKMSKDKFCY